MKISLPERKAWLKPVVLLLVNAAMSYGGAVAQDVVNDTLFVSMSSITELVFPEPSEGRILNGDGSYQVRGGSKTSLHITARRKGAAPQPLVVSEGGRVHKFIIAYREGAASQRIGIAATEAVDTSEPPATKPANATTTNDRSKKALVTPKGRDREKVKQLLEAGNRYYQQEAWKSAKESYEQIVGFKFKEQPLVSERLQEIDAKLEAIAAEMERRFGEAVKNAERAHQNKEYRKAAEAYRQALSLKPGDPEIEQKITALQPLIAKQQQEQDAALVQESLKKGEQAIKAKRYLAAEAEYLKIIDKDPSHPLALKKLKEIGPRVNQERYLQQRKTGDSLFRLAKYDAAKAAYQIAGKAKPNDTYIAGQLQKIRQQGLLAEKRSNYATAIAGADKAFTDQDFETALSEYQRARRIFPDSTYPGKQIVRIGQLQKGVMKQTSAKEN